MLLLSNAGKPTELREPQGHAARSQLLGDSSGKRHFPRFRWQSPSLWICGDGLGLVVFFLVVHYSLIIRNHIYSAPILIVQNCLCFY